jgi:hypothetical protein
MVKKHVSVERMDEHKMPIQNAVSLLLQLFPVHLQMNLSAQNKHHMDGNVYVNAVRVSFECRVR